MSVNLIQAGNIIEYTNGTGSNIAAGDLVKIGVRVGVALVDIDNGDAGSVAMSGVYEVDKEASLAVAQGDLLYLDATSGELDKTATSQTLAGFAFAASAGSATVVQVSLNA